MCYSFDLRGRGYRAWQGQRLLQAYEGKDEVSVFGLLFDARMESRVHNWRLKVKGGDSVCD